MVIVKTGHIWNLILKSVKIEGCRPTDLILAFLDLHELLKNQSRPRAVLPPADIQGGTRYTPRLSLKIQPESERRRIRSCSWEADISKMGATSPGRTISSFLSWTIDGGKMQFKTNFPGSYAATVSFKTVPDNIISTITVTGAVGRSTLPRESSRSMF